MDIKIYDTLSGKKKCVSSSYVEIYLCGITPYDNSHIGHARTVVVFDILRRYLENKNIIVRIVQNFTDIDDKIIQRAKNENLSTTEISSKYIEHYYRDFDTLNVKRASIYPKATEHIQNIIELIQHLLNKNIAYVTKNGVYFSVLKFNKYGKLSKKNINELISGLRIPIDSAKNSPIDFALWKFFRTNPIWNSPWGKGRPGWHIECSAMCIKYLSKNFEIHGGGNDLIFPHHENEIAQSESYTSKSLAKIWMHIGLVTVNGKKMSKSTGNIKVLSQLLSTYGSNIIRLFCISTHYLKPVSYSTIALKEIITKWRQMELCYYKLVSIKNTCNSSNENIEKIIIKYKTKFDYVMSNNFNTVHAFSSFMKLVKQIDDFIMYNTIAESTAKKAITEFERFFNIFGLKISKFTNEEKNLIDTLILERKKLREEKQYEKADKIRKRLETMNITLLDYHNTTTWIKKEEISSD